MIYNSKRLKIQLSLLICTVFLFGCPTSDDDIIEIPEEPLLVTYEVLFFSYTPDTGNNTSRLQYQIKFSNPNDFPIRGFSKITINADGLVSSNISSSNSQCYNIEANADCIYGIDAEDSHDLGMVTSIELVSVEYTIEE